MAVITISDVSALQSWSRLKGSIRVASLFRWLLLAALLAMAALVVVALGRRAPQDVPWGVLDLGAPLGRFTGRKLAALGHDAAACRAVLDRAGIDRVTLPVRRDGPACGYRDGIRAAVGGPLAIRYMPPVGARCAVVAALAVWEWQVVQPAAERHFRSSVTAIDDYGSYNCRDIGSDHVGDGRISEHASANAVDIAGFRLSDGRRITVARDWNGPARDRAFLRDVRDGACTLFATTLSPDYNAAHRDHLHLDQADRGATGSRACR